MSPGGPLLSRRRLHAGLAAAALFVLVPVVPVAAATSPLGFTLGKTTQSDVERSLPRDKIKEIDPTREGRNRFQIDPAAFDFDGLEKVLLVFDTDQNLTAMVLSIEKRRFYDVLDDLRSKYAAENRTDEEIIQHGNALFRSGDDWVILDMPSLSFSLTLTYITAELWREAESRSDEKAIQKHQQDSGKP